MIRVQLAPGDTGMFWDRDPAHEDGEVRVLPGEVAELAETSTVMQALHLGRLQRVGDDEPPRRGSRPSRGRAPSDAGDAGAGAGTGTGPGADGGEPGGGAGADTGGASPAGEGAS
jgi:hypothetical protein